ncbi:MAG: energy transducer TonB [Lutibacter sp.]|nr:MAG: energy transducer TonB [Lutibacter sp.]
MTKKYKLILTLCVGFFFFSMSSFGQEVEVVDENSDDIAFAIIEKVPVYPGCKGEDNRLLRDCMNLKIKKHVASTFNTKKARNIGLIGKQKIYVQFKIMKTGKVKIMRVSAPHKKLEKEARRVVNKLPKMIPGVQDGRNVNVTYMLPIGFRVE